MKTFIIAAFLLKIFAFTNGQSTISYSYDTQGRLLSEIYQSKYQLSFAYDIEGNFTNKTVTNFGITGIKDTNIASTTNIQVFPNPAKDKVNIQTNNPRHKINEIIITDVSGRCLYSEKTNYNSTQINTAHFNKGVYFISVKTTEKLEIVKLLID